MNEKYLIFKCSREIRYFTEYGGFIMLNKWKSKLQIYTGGKVHETLKEWETRDDKEAVQILARSLSELKSNGREFTRVYDNTDELTEAAEPCYNWKYGRRIVWKETTPVAI